MFAENSSNCFYHESCEIRKSKYMPEFLIFRNISLNFLNLFFLILMNCLIV